MKNLNIAVLIRSAALILAPIVCVLWFIPVKTPQLRLSPQVPELALYSDFAELVPVKELTRDVGIGKTDQWIYVGQDTNVVVLSAFGPAHKNIGGTNFVLASRFFGGTNHIWLAIRK